jgi:hypothetical protein
MWDDEEGLYCDARTSAQDVRSRRDAILGRLYGPVAETGRRVLDGALKKKSVLGEDEKSGWLLNYAWIINTPMEMGIAPWERACRALERLHGPEFIGPYGMYLSGLFRDEAMTISTGVMAVAQAKYGYADRALELLGRMFRAFNLASPGCISEMLPDHGCFVQAWTVYAVMVPIVQYFFGVQPSASENLIRVCPCMPRVWPRASLEKTPVLDGELDVHYRRENGRASYRIAFTGKTPVSFEYRKAGALQTVFLREGFLEISIDAD